MEENSCSDNLSNVGQGSPMKVPAQIQMDQALAQCVSQIKSMTPMPKLVHALSQPLPRKDSQGSNDQQVNSLQAKAQAEMMSRERT